MEIKKNIDEIIRKEGLDEKEVYVAEESISLSQAPTAIDLAKKALIAGDEISYVVKRIQQVFGATEDEAKEIVWEAEQKARMVANEASSKEIAGAKLKVSMDLDSLWRVLQNNIPVGVTKEELTKYYDEMSKTFTLPFEWESFLINAGVEYTKEGDKEGESASISISVGPHSLEEISAWEDKLEDLDIVFSVEVDTENNVVRWQVNDEDEEYIIDFLNNLGVQYKNAKKEVASLRLVEDITSEDFFAYVDAMKSGAANLNDVETVCMVSGLSRDTVKTIQQNYLELARKYGVEQSSKHKAQEDDPYVMAKEFVREYTGVSFPLEEIKKILRDEYLIPEDEINSLIKETLEEIVASKKRRYSTKEKVSSNPTVK